MTSGWKNTSKSKHGTSRKSVEEFNRTLLRNKTGAELRKFEELFNAECPKCGEVMWYHRVMQTEKICPTDERY